MARLARAPSSSEDDERDDNTPSPPQGRRRVTNRALNSLSPSPVASVSSDKENRSSTSASRQDGAKAAMPPPLLPASNPSPSATPRGSKRRRLAERDGAPHASQLAHERELEEVSDVQFYDPDQDMRERRAVRKGLRDLTRDLNDSRTEFLAPDSTGLVDTLHKANEYFANVRQTSDATLDSRLLVSTADLSYKKTAQLALGDTAQSIDVDEFVSKCITFMRRGEGPRADGGPPPPGQRRNRQRTMVDPDDNEGSDLDGSVDEGDALDWEFLGRRACFPHNRRPAVPGFLLGPLSLQKRARTQRARTGRLQRRDPADVVHAEELQAEDIEKVENSNLTVLCTRIRDDLDKVQTAGEAAVEAEASEDMTEAEVKALMEKHGISDDSGVGFFNFVINPDSFGQTVENLFYVSFLIRDGNVGISQDSAGLPTLHATQPRKAAEIKEQGVQKHQAIFSLDYQMWQDLIRAFGITRPMIAHRRSDEDDVPVSARGWYG